MWLLIFFLLYVCNEDESGRWWCNLQDNYYMNAPLHNNHHHRTQFSIRMLIFTISLLKIIIIETRANILNVSKCNSFCYFYFREYWNSFEHTHTHKWKCRSFQKEKQKDPKWTRESQTLKKKKKVFLRHKMKCKFFKSFTLKFKSSKEKKEKKNEHNNIFNITFQAEWGLFIFKAIASRYMY